MNLHIQSENCKDTMLKKYESETDFHFHFYFPFFLIKIKLILYRKFISSDYVGEKQIAINSLKQSYFFCACGTLQFCQRVSSYNYIQFRIKL